MTLKPTIYSTQQIKAVIASPTAQILYKVYNKPDKTNPHAEEINTYRKSSSPNSS